MAQLTYISLHFKMVILGMANIDSICQVNNFIPAENCPFCTIDLNQAVIQGI
ncbi:unnamed protein product [Paramecium sonneborni]|uniref:Uncharacterized protein n=1 Tax=Paramecium sonneborni TaxID=65129 RepID=A0A8S1NIA4_9CILI|nr:unnamed protein product [Paramecium sonneborni]